MAPKRAKKVLTRPRKSPPPRFKVTVSHQAYDILRQLKEHGFYGRTEPEVAARLLHEALLKLLPVPPELKPPAAIPRDTPSTEHESKA